MSRKVPPQYDIDAIAEAARLLTEARKLIAEAAAIYQDCAIGEEADPAGALGYWGAWKATTTWLDSMHGIQKCHSEWTGGALSEPGAQTEWRWPTDWGWSPAFGEPPMSREGQV
jgi:hypothetical protein